MFKILNLFKSKTFWQIELLLLFILIFIIKLRSLDFPYWFDEANTIFYVKQNVIRMIQFTIHDFSPPFYYLILHLWVKLFGDSEIVTGFLSLIFDTLSVGAIFLLAKELFNSKTGQIAALLYFGSLISINYATETRMYSLLVLLSTLSIYFLWTSLMTNKKYQWIFYVFFALLSLYTHYSFLFIIAGQILFVIILFYFLQNKTARINKIKHFLLSQIIIFIIFFPWLIVFIERVIDTQIKAQYYWTNVISPIHEHLIVFAGEIMLNHIFAPTGAKILILFAEVIILLLFLKGIFEIKLNNKLNNIFIKWKDKIIEITFLLLLIFIPLFILICINTDAARYVIVIAPLFCIILANGINSIKDKRVNTICVALIICISLYSFSLNTKKRQLDSFYQYKDITKYIEDNEKSSSREMILVNSYIDKTIINYYYQGGLDVVGFLPKTESQDHEINYIRNIGKTVVYPNNIHKIKKYVNDSQIVWLVLTKHHYIYDPLDLTAEWFQKNCQLLEVKKFPDDTINFNITNVLKYKCH